MIKYRMSAQAEYRRIRQPLLTHVATACATLWAAALRIGVVLAGERLSVDEIILPLGGIRLDAAAVVGGNGNNPYAFGSDDPIGKLNRCWSSGERLNQGRQRT